MWFTWMRVFGKPLTDTVPGRWDWLMWVAPLCSNCLFGLSEICKKVRRVTAARTTTGWKNDDNNNSSDSSSSASTPCASAVRKIQYSGKKNRRNGKKKKETPKKQINFSLSILDVFRVNGPYSDGITCSRFPIRALR